MDIEELKAAITIEEAASSTRIRTLKRAYAEEHNPVRAGDVITDHMCSIVVSKIQYWLSIAPTAPQCVYHGAALTKQGKLFKNKSSTKIYQSNLETINGVSVKKT